MAMTSCERLRRDRDWSQRELAAAAGVGRSAVQKIECRRPVTREIALKVAKALKAKLATIMADFSDAS